MMNLADIARTINPSLTRNQLKVMRAQLRRAKLTNQSDAGITGGYTVNVHRDVVADARCSVGGVVIVQAISEIV